MEVIAVEQEHQTGQRELIRLFRERSARVHGFVLARCGDSAVAEDVTAQTFEAAAVRFARGRGDEVSEAWLTTVAQRRLVDHWRRAGRQRRMIEWVAGNVRQVADPPHVPDDDVVAALDSLPASQRAVVVLRYLDDWSVAEIARGLDLTYRATESLLARGRRSLRAALEERE